MSGGGFRFDAVLAAIVLSVLVHAGLMLWVGPKVMTQPTTGARYRPRHERMTVREAAKAVSLTEIAQVRDLDPLRAAPAAAENVAGTLPTPDSALPAPSVGTLAPQAVALTEIVGRLAPVSDAPLLRPPEVRVAPAESVRMTVEASGAVAGDAAESLWTIRPSVPSVDASVAPSLARPAEPTLAAAPEETSRTVEKIAASERAPVPDFTPADEVYAVVDERAVEREKEAVRGLVNAAGARDIATVADIACVRQTEGRSVYFRVTVTPRPGTLRAVPKDVVILIDASGSIGDDRLKSCRKAAREILRSCANSDDRFNLVAFRDRYSYCFRNWRACDADSFAAADAWLNRLAAHGRTDVFSTIASVLTLPRDPKRPLIAMVVTDGDANAGVSDTHQILAKFAALNDGLVSVYMYGVKETANRRLIDCLTRSNRGEGFVYGGWRWNAGSKLEELSRHFRDPLLTDLRLTWSSRTFAESYPRLLRNLYDGNAVTVFGRTGADATEIAFSLKGLAGAQAYEGYFKLPLAKAAEDPGVKAAWEREKAVSLSL